MVEIIFLFIAIAFAYQAHKINTTKHRHSH